MEADSKGKGDAFAGMPTRLCWPRRRRTRASATVPAERKTPPRYSPGQAEHLLLIPKRTVSSGAPRWDHGVDLQKSGTEQGEWRQECLWVRLQSGFGDNKATKENPGE